MWLLENAGDAFQAGQLVISDKTISRKHLTIEVDSVRDGDGRDPDSRSVVTIEDLSTKIGTVVNGTQIRGQRFVLLQDRNEIKMGHMADVFRITWMPVVLSVSFSSKELRAGGPDPWAALRAALEPLDVKYLAEYDRARTTHVVAKKRNTSKGLQALINGKYIVTDMFVAAVVAAAGADASDAGDTGDTGDTTSAAQPSLETDFDAAWPDALDYLPPRGDEPSNRPVSTYGPDARRAAVFEGYTFVFYDAKQYENLLPPIANGRGKALLGTVVPGVTTVDDFVRYVKGVAGEQGLGEFEDGGAGRGVVVVRHVPAKGEHVTWFTRFTTAVALRLDHRLIDQREFLDAILAVEPAMLRRPLEVEELTVVGSAGGGGGGAMDLDLEPGRGPNRARDGPSAAEVRVSARTRARGAENGGAPVEPDVPPPPAPPASLSQASSTRRMRARRGGAATSRFKGFDVDLDLENDEMATVAAVSMPPDASGGGDDEENDKMFVSQTPGPMVDDDDDATVSGAIRSNKRSAIVAASDDDDVMEDIAPTAAAVKRRRIAAGIAAVPARATPGAEEYDEGDGDGDGDGNGNNNDDGGAASGRRGAKPATAVVIKKEKLRERENAILDQARRNREAAERRLIEEREQLAARPDDGFDAAAIRRLTLVETIAVRDPSGAAHANHTTRAQDIADGRWDPRWNGRRNFKRFRRPGDAAGRLPSRVIVALEPAKTKEYGIGDDYWLEAGGGGGDHNHGNDANGSEKSSIPVPSTAATTASRGSAADRPITNRSTRATGSGLSSLAKVRTRCLSRSADETVGNIVDEVVDEAVDKIVDMDGDVDGVDGDADEVVVRRGTANLRVHGDGADDDDAAIGGGRRGRSADHAERSPSFALEVDSASWGVDAHGSSGSHALPGRPLVDPSPTPSDDLPRTRAGKVAARTAATRQSQAAAAAAAAAVSSSSRPSGTTTTTRTLQGQAASLAPDTRPTRSKRAAPPDVPATVRMQSPAKRPRRGAAAAVAERTTGAVGSSGSGSGSGSTVASGSTMAAGITIRDSDGDSDDEDDGLRFKFRSRGR